MAWSLIDMNIAIIVWIGIGGMMAAFAGPLVLGALWKGVTKAGAYSGLIAGFGTFVILHTQQINPAWFEGTGLLHVVVSWLHGEGPNPTSCAAIGEGRGRVDHLLRVQGHRAVARRASRRHVRRDRRSTGWLA